MFLHLFFLMLLAAGAAGAATLSVGPGRQFRLPCDAFRAANAGDAIEIDSGGVYDGDVCEIAKASLTIRGTGAGRPHIRAAGKDFEGKGIWVVRGGAQNVTVENIEFSGARVTDHNGAGIRVDPGAGITIRNCHFHDNENGVLVGDALAFDVLVEYSIFENNGFGDGLSHNIYVNHVRRFTFRGNYSARARMGQLVKSRALETYLLSNRLSQENGNGSWEADISEGGIAYVIGNIIQQTGASTNGNMLGYAAEGAAAGRTHQLYVVNNTFVNQSNCCAMVFVGSSATTPVVIRNNIFYGGGTVTTQAAAQQANNFLGDPLFTDVTGLDFTLRANSRAIDFGADAGQGLGFALRPELQYRHTACAESRTTTGVSIDAGAYEFGSPAGGAQGPDRCRQQLSPVSVVHGASFTTGALAPGTIAAAFGTGFSPNLVQATAAPLPRSLGGVSVQINAVDAPLYFVGPTQINFQVPYGLDAGDATMVVQANGLAKPPIAIRIANSSPGIFLQNGTDQGVIQNPDYGVNTPSAAAPPGSIVVVYLTGIGPLSSFIATGQATRTFPLVTATLPFSAILDGKEVDVKFLGMTPGLVGVAQANIQIPADLAPGTYPLAIIVGGVVSNTVKVTVGG